MCPCISAAKQPLFKTIDTIDYFSILSRTNSIRRNNIPNCLRRKLSDTITIDREHYIIDCDTNSNAALFC